MSNCLVPSTWAALWTPSSWKAPWRWTCEVRVTREASPQPPDPAAQPRAASCVSSPARRLEALPRGSRAGPRAWPANPHQCLLNGKVRGPVRVSHADWTPALVPPWPRTERECGPGKLQGSPLPRGHCGCAGSGHGGQQPPHDDAATRERACPTLGASGLGVQQLRSVPGAGLRRVRYLGDSDREAGAGPGPGPGRDSKEAADLCSWV